jgi:hypothetical protein
MDAYDYALHLLTQPYSPIENSAQLESAVYAKFGENDDMINDVWAAWEYYENNY